jgi:uncharacterized protein (TIGR02145 family)/uncharacterized repeat protein (TIGR02543 family)
MKHLKKILLMLLLSSASFLMTCINNPANPYDKINTKIFLYACSAVGTINSTVIEDSVGNTIKIGFNSNLPSNIDSVRLFYTVQYSDGSKNTILGVFKDISSKSSRDTLWDSIVFSDSGTKIITATAYISNNTTCSDSIVATIHPKPVNHKPDIQITGNKEITIAQICTLTVGAADIDSFQTYYYSVLKKPAEATFSKPYFIWKPSTGDIGKNTIIMTVTDNGYPPMSDTDSVTITVSDTSTATDQQVPTLRFISPSKDTVTGADSCIVSVICRDASGIASVKCYVDTTSFATAKSTDSIYTATIKGLKAGRNNTVKFKATDASTNANSDSIMVNIKYDNDTTKPSISLVTPSKDTISTSSSSYTITILCSDASGIASVVGVLNSVSSTGTAGTDSTYTIIVSNLTQDVYDTVKITVTDNSLRGNKTTMNVMIKYDPTLTDGDGPIITKISGPKSGDTVSSPGFTLVDSITDPSGVDSVYAKVNGGTQSVLTGTSNKYTYTGTLPEGADTITVTAKDKSAAGNRSTQTIIVYYIKAPTITVQPTAVTTCPSTSATFSVTASGTGTLTYTWYKGATAKDTGSTYTISSVATTDSGYYKVVVSNYSGADTSDSVKLSLTRYYVAFNSNGGSTVDTQWVLCNYYATEPASPTKSGYKFAGWYTNKELTSAIFDFSSSSNVITTNRTLYAGWSQLYTVTYDANGGSGTVPKDDSSYTSGSTVKVLSNTLSRPHYTFSKWNTSSDGSGIPYTSGSTFSIASNVTLYAIWIGDTCKVYFSLQGGTVSGDSVKKVNYGDTLSSLPSPTNKNCTFAGWWTKTVGSGDSIKTSRKIIADTTFYAKWTVTDADGNVYKTVLIGNQTWTVEDLRATTYKSGNSIPKVTDSATWDNLSTAGYCYYNNTTNADSIKKFGALYNWYAADSENFISGWHLPDTSDWSTLQNYLIAYGYNYDSTTTGNKIGKSMAAQTDWSTSTITGAIGNDLTKNNSSGFTGLPGGCRNGNGSFSTSNLGDWWSATEGDASRTYSHYLYYGFVYLNRSYDYKSCGYSVRLLRD